MVVDWWRTNARPGRVGSFDEMGNLNQLLMFRGGRIVSDFVCEVLHLYYYDPSFFSFFFGGGGGGVGGGGVGIWVWGESFVGR